jgi:hypothetical protein
MRQSYSIPHLVPVDLARFGMHLGRRRRQLRDLAFDGIALGFQLYQPVTQRAARLLSEQCIDRLADRGGDAGELQPFVNPHPVGLVARDAVEVFGGDDGERAGTGIAPQRMFAAKCAQRRCW